MIIFPGRMKNKNMSDISLVAPSVRTTSARSVRSTSVGLPCRPRTKVADAAAVSAVASVGAGRPKGTPGWLVAMFAIGLALSIAAFVYLFLIRRDLEQLKQGKATLDSLRSKYRIASVLTYLTFVFTLAVLCILVINKNSFLRYGLLSAVALLLLLGQAVLLQGAIDDAIIVVQASKTTTPPIKLNVATFALVLSGLTSLALLVGLILSAIDDRRGRTDDDVYTNLPDKIPNGKAVRSASVSLKEPSVTIQEAEELVAVPAVSVTRMIPVAEKTSTVISSCPQQPPVVVERIVQVQPPPPPQTPVAASFDAFLRRLGKPPAVTNSFVVPI